MVFNNGKHIISMKAKAKLKKTTVTKLSTPEKFIFDFSKWREMSGREFHVLKMEAINFYHQHVKPSELYSEVWDFMKSHGYDDATIDICKKGIGYNGIDTSTAVLCKLLNTGCPDYNPKENEYWLSLNDQSKPVRPLSEYIQKAIQNGIVKGRNVIAAENSSVQKKAERTARDIILEQVSPLIVEFEGFLDDWRKGLVKMKDLNAHTRLSKLSSAHAKIIQKHFARMEKEAKELLDGNDADLVEAYRGMNKKEQREYASFFSNILSACDMITQTKVQQRKPRKKRAINIEKLVSRVKYCEKDVSLGLVSLHPRVIPSSEALWVFNRKYNILTCYRAENGSTLSIKGTTIQNFDKKLSEAKRIRKPAEVMKKFAAASKSQRQKFLSTIRTKSQVPTGRLNADCLIVRNSL